METRRVTRGLTAINALDLSNIARKLQEPEPEGKGWDKEQVQEAEIWYRRYLEVCLRNPDFPAVPNALIDAIWHQHILDTREYARDCEAIFGEFLHHYPYFGLNGDAEKRDDAFHETNKKYMELFGEDCTMMGQSSVVKGASCNHSGSGTGCGQGCSRGQVQIDRPGFRDPESMVYLRAKCSGFGRPEYLF